MRVGLCPWRRQGGKGESFLPYGWTSENYVICVCFHCHRTSYYTTYTLQGRRAKSHVDTQTIQPGLGDFVHRPPIDPYLTSPCYRILAAPLAYALAEFLFIEILAGDVSFVDLFRSILPVVPTECDVLIVRRQHNDKEWKFKEQHAEMWENIAGVIRYSRPRGFNIAGASAPVTPGVPTPLSVFERTIFRPDEGDWRRRHRADQRCKNVQIKKFFLHRCWTQAQKGTGSDRSRDAVQ